MMEWLAYGYGVMACISVLMAIAYVVSFIAHPFGLGKKKRRSRLF